MSNWSQRDDSSQLSSGERADHVAAELQAAFGGPASDVQRVCSLLCLLRREFSEQAPKNWPADTVKRLWLSIIGALRVAQAPEVQVAACAAVEALGQSCSSCTDLDREPSAVDDAIMCVIETLKASSSKQVKVAAIKALLSLSGCLNCRCYYDKATQELLGERGAVRLLLTSLPRFLTDATADPAQQQQLQAGTAAGASGTAPAQERGPEDGANTVADIFRALHYTCLLNPANIARLLAEGGYPLIVQALSVMGRELNVQEHGAMLLAEMACSSDMAGRDVLESIVTVANIARLQLQDKYIEVARAAVWSLARLASHTLGQTGESGDKAEKHEGALAQAWPLLSDPVLRVVVSMLQSCHLQDDPLVKHCLDYIAVIASAATMHSTGQGCEGERQANGGPCSRGSSGGGFAAANNTNTDSAAACSSDAPTMPSNDMLSAAAIADGTLFTSSGGSGSGASLLSLFRLAMDAVLATARVASDIRLQAVVLRTLHVLLHCFPRRAALQLGASRQVEILDQVVRIASSARQSLEQQQTQQQQQHHNHSQQAHHVVREQAQQQVYASKDLFIINVYALTVAGALIEPNPMAGGPGAGVSYQSQVLNCLTSLVRHLSEGGGSGVVEPIVFDETPSGRTTAVTERPPAPYLCVGCCRYACHCCFIHDLVRGADVVAACRAAARLQIWCGGGPDGVNATDRDGCGALHFLAASGVAPLLAAFIEAAGPGLDFLRRTRGGANALQLARSRKHTEAVQILEVSTESAAKAAQDALLKELEEEGANDASHGAGGSSKRAGGSASGASTTSRQHKNISSGGGGGGGGHDPHAQHGAAHGPGSASPAGGAQQVHESTEARRAREELERKRRAAEEEYEAALEQRRRQLEEEARQQAAEEARLIELAQAESLRMSAAPPPSLPLQPVEPPRPQPEAVLDEQKVQEQEHQLLARVSDSPDAVGSTNAIEQHVLSLPADERQPLLQARQLSPSVSAGGAPMGATERLFVREAGAGCGSGRMSAGGAAAPPAGPLEASLQAAAVAVASGGHLAPDMAQLLAHLATEQQDQQRQQLLVQQQLMAAQQELVMAPHNGSMGGGVGRSSSGRRSPLSSMDEQVTMLHGSAGPGAALGMSRIVSKGSFTSEDTTMGVGVSVGVGRSAAGFPGGGGGGLLASVPSTSGSSGTGLGGLSMSYSAGGSVAGASAGGSFSGYTGSFSNLLHTGGPMGLSSSTLEAPPGLIGGPGGLLGPGAPPPDVAAATPAGLLAMGAGKFGGFGAPGLPPGVDQRVGAGTAAVLPRSDSVPGSIDSAVMPGSSAGSMGGGWPGNTPGYAPGPAAFISSTLGAATAGAPRPPGLTRGGPSSNYLAIQGAPSPTPPASHTQLHQTQPQHQLGGVQESWGMAGPAGSGLPQQMSAGTVGSHADLHSLASVSSLEARQRGLMLRSGGSIGHGLIPSGAAQPSMPSPTAGERVVGRLHDVLAAAGGEMWELTEESARGTSRQLWLGNVQAGLPAGHLQALCQQFGPVQDVVMAPGTLSAVVLFVSAEAAAHAAHTLHGREIPNMSYEDKPIIVRYCAVGPTPHQDGSSPPPQTPSGAVHTGGGAGEDGVLGLVLPPGMEAALAAAGFGPNILTAAMQGLLPLEQQQALHAVLFEASGAVQLPPQPQLLQQGRMQSQGLAPQQPPQQRSSLGSMGQLHPTHGSMGHLVGLASGNSGTVTSDSISDFVTLQAAAMGHPISSDQQQSPQAQHQQHHGAGSGPSGSVICGASEDGDGGGVAGAGGPVSGGGAAGSSTGGGGASTSGELETGGVEGDPAADVPEGKPSRHLWLGNIPLKPNKLAMELLFARFGPLESVRVFPGKTFAFVNYLAPQHAVAAKMALDGQPAPSVTGSKPMVIRYQKDTSTVPANLGMVGGKSMSRSSSTQNLSGLTAAASLARLLDEDLPPEPAVNLSNKLNPNNIHYDRELAARYKRMSKAEKEALWAQDRAMQALGANAAAAAAAVNAGAAGIAGLLDPNATAARLLAQAGLGNLAGLGGGAGSDFLLPRVMSASALDYLAANSGGGGGGGAAAAAAAAVGGGGGGHGGLFRVNTTQSLLGMQQAANAAMLLPQMGAAAAAGGLQGLLGQH
ncbi:hypothetical protein Vretifemale_639, partial [Volvox reticuliferus]